jgi:hypothetical protein
VRDRLASLDMDAVRADVQPFLESRQDALLISQEYLLGLLPE